MPSFHKQKEIVEKKRDKVHEFRRKVEEQEGILHAQTAEVQAFSREKGYLTRQLGLLEVRYEEALSMLERHEQRLARSGRPGANGDFERNLRRDVEEKRIASKEAKDRVKAIEKAIDKAERSERKAQEKLNEVQSKLSDANLQLRTEHGRMLRMARS
ncbi:hypothetical protein F5X97DRAFT_342784 [Nemania serpens]|nr:hypothetical protein F5X97DRAFT_342784 [Nemania serpens]